MGVGRTPSQLYRQILTPGRGHGGLIRYESFKKDLTNYIRERAIKLVVFRQDKEKNRDGG